MDLTNFCRELSHAQMRRLLREAAGNTFDFPYLAVLQLCKDIGGHYAANAPLSPDRSAEPPRKKSRLTGWNIFVGVSGAASQATIQDGSFMRSCAREWHALPVQEKDLYQRIADRRADESDESEGEGLHEAERQADAAIYRGSWGLGNGVGQPMAEQYFTTPKYSEISEAVDEFSCGLCYPVLHSHNALPHPKTRYDNPCVPKACRNGEYYRLGHRIQMRFAEQVHQTSTVGDAFLFTVGPPGGRQVVERDIARHSSLLASACGNSEPSPCSCP